MASHVDARGLAGVFGVPQAVERALGFGGFGLARLKLAFDLGGALAERLRVVPDLLQSAEACPDNSGRRSMP